MDKYEMDEIVNMAIMTKTPHIIVEGVNDVCVYEAIADSTNINMEVYCIQMIAGYAGGNDGVAEAIEYCYTLPLGGRDVKDYILGIVDRDARFYRHEIPSLPALLILQYYSIESHFASKAAIEPIVRRVTRISTNDELSVDRIFNDIEDGISDLYYFSLDALKNAVDLSYLSVVAFSDKPGRRMDSKTIADLQHRKRDLDDFAKVYGLENSLESLKQFSKGKWVLAAYSEGLHREISGLVEKCKSGAIAQCRMCRFDVNAPCLFKAEDGFTKKTIYSLLLKEVRVPEIDYIRDRMTLVGESAIA